MSTLDEVRAQLEAWDAARPRSLQREPGASQTFACRAATVLRANGVPETDRTDGWKATVGTLIHRLVEKTTPPDVMPEHTVRYRGVPATVDRYNPARRVLSDVKTKGGLADIEKVRAKGPARGHLGQIMLGAAGLIEEGHPVDSVELLYLPRDGSLDDAFLWSAPFDRALANEAADWHEQVRALIAERAGWQPEEIPDGLRDEVGHFCVNLCPFFTLCKGEREAPPPVEDPMVVEAAAEYLTASAEAKRLYARAQRAREALPQGVDLRAVGLRWQGGNAKTETVLDVDRMRAEYEAIIGDAPVTVVEKVTAVSLHPVKERKR